MRKQIAIENKEEQVVERMKKMIENMSEEERVAMMERCFEFMKGKETRTDKERSEKKMEDSARFPDMGDMAECCPEMMKTFSAKLMACPAGKGKKEKKSTDEKPEKPGCCKG